MKKRKRRRKVWKIVLAVLAAVILLAVIAVFGFRTRSIEVEGNEYYSANSIIAWIENDELSVNSLYLLLKYNFTEAELPSAAESLTVSLKNPWTVHVTVKEKEMLGYVDYDGACLYFDKNGIASLRTKELLEGVPVLVLQRDLLQQHDQRDGGLERFGGSGDHQRGGRAVLGDHDAGALADAGIPVRHVAAAILGPVGDLAKPQLFKGDAQALRQPLAEEFMDAVTEQHLADAVAYAVHAGCVFHG